MRKPKHLERIHSDTLLDYGHFKHYNYAPLRCIFSCFKCLCKETWLGKTKNVFIFYFKEKYGKQNHIKCRKALSRWGISVPWSAHPGPTQDLQHCSSVSWENSLSDSVEMPQLLGEHSHILSTVIRHEGHPYVHFNGQVPLTPRWLADSWGSHC